MVKRRHVPLRTCISCGLKTAKRDLLRVVAPPEGGVAADQTGKRNGRGAYICPDCRQSPDKLNQGRLEHSLRTKIGEEDWRVLLDSVIT